MRKTVHKHTYCQVPNIAINLAAAETNFGYISLVRNL